MEFKLEGTDVTIKMPVNDFIELNDCVDAAHETWHKVVSKNPELRNTRSFNNAHTFMTDFQTTIIGFASNLLMDKIRQDPDATLESFLTMFITSNSGE